jgi:hypothetical protein
LVIEEVQAVVHEADPPDGLSDFPHADIPTGEDRAEISSATAEAQPAALRDGDGAVMERILEIG